MSGINTDQNVLFINAGYRNNRIIILYALFVQNRLVGAITVDDYNLRKISGQLFSDFFVDFDHFGADAKLLQTWQQVAGDSSSANYQRRFDTLMLIVTPRGETRDFNILAGNKQVITDFQFCRTIRDDNV